MVNRLGGLTALAVLACAACNGSSTAVPVAIKPTTRNVDVGNNFFNPVSISISKGDTVGWHITAGQHALVIALPNGAPGPDSSGVVDMGASWSHIFPDTGYRQIYCRIHRFYGDIFVKP